MNRKRVCLLLTIFLLPFYLIAQPKAKKLLLEASLGTHLGWWLYQKGSVNSFLDQGQDYTHHAFIPSLDLGVLYNFKVAKVGIGVTFSALIEDEMNTEIEGLIFGEYPIAEKSVQFRKYYAQGEYHLINGPKYRLAPHFRIGWFQIKSDHPEEDNFGRRIFYEIGLQNEFQLDRIILFFRPQYGFASILPKEENYPDEKHKIYQVGIQFGIRIGLF